jgi:(p)ppGpp synthase/HD superfamily hydrolase
MVFVFLALLLIFNGVDVVLLHHQVMSETLLDTQLEKITAFAAEAHGSQTRKYTPDPYIVHPVRVMKLCRQYTEDLPVLGAALLHDVLEDTIVTKTEIREFLSSIMQVDEADKTITLVEELTDVYVKSAYPQWNRRKRKAKELERLAVTSADSQTIKYADIIDNCTEIVRHDPDFAKVFLRECSTILKSLVRGNDTLRKIAIQLVQDKLTELKKIN